MRTRYQQPVTSTLQLKELRCKGPSLSALSEGHQRPWWSESAAALTVWRSPLSLQRNLFVLRMFTDPRKEKQLSFLFVGTAAQTESCGPFLCERDRASGYVVLLGLCLSCLCLLTLFSKFPMRSWSNSMLWNTVWQTTKTKRQSSMLKGSHRHTPDVYKNIIWI